MRHARRSRLLMFQLLGVFVSLLNLWAWVRLRHWLRAHGPRGVRLVWPSAVLFVLAFHPALALGVFGWSGMRAARAALPDAAPMILIAAQLGVVFWLLAIGLRALLRSGLSLGRRALGRTAPEPVDAGRRQVVLASAALPFVAFSASGGGVAAARQRPVVNRIALPVRRDLTALHGITIAQVSDVHVGSFMDAERLDEIRDVMNSLRADVHVITGDLLDNHISQMEEAARFIRGLHPRRSDVFFAMGNHEYIAARRSSVDAVHRGIEDAGAHILLDDALRVPIGGDHLWLGGIDYPPSHSRKRSLHVGRSTEESLERALAPMRDDGAPRILLSHHPRTFVEAREHPIDLMLSGHTHGGQISLGRIGDHELTPVLPVEFYHRGLYEHQGRRLYVNAGAGGWLPLRINCPPEITLIELVAARG